MIFRFRYYNFVISSRVTGQKSSCHDPGNIKFETYITNPQTGEAGGNLPVEKVIIRKGISLIFIGEKAFASELDGNYDFCVRAVVIDQQTVSTVNSNLHNLNFHNLNGFF